MTREEESAWAWARVTTDHRHHKDHLKPGQVVSVDYNPFRFMLTCPCGTRFYVPEPDARRP